MGIRAELRGVTDAERTALQARTEHAALLALVLSVAYVVILMSLKGCSLTWGGATCWHCPSGMRRRCGSRPSMPSTCRHEVGCATHRRRWAGAGRPTRRSSADGCSPTCGNRVTFVCVTATDYAATELALWEQALREQQDTEEQLMAAYDERRYQRALALLPEAKALRTRADLLLAEAVKVKCTFRDQRFLDSSMSTTSPGALIQASPTP
jgi:hypothetical protein